MEEGAVLSEVLQRESLEYFFIVNLTGSETSPRDTSGCVFEGVSTEA